MLGVESRTRARGLRERRVSLETAASRRNSMRHPVLRALPALLLLTSIALVLGRPASTVPLFAARTGLMCGTCHFDPNGGGPRNAYGFSFARNRHSLEADPDTLSPWHDLQLVNRVGENVPLYFGVNQRFMLLATRTLKSDSLDRLGFF